ncbi:hypothetical protein ACFE04_000475 [Oxalis oulophora]
MGLPSSSRLYDFSAPLCSWQGVVCDSTNKYVIQLTMSGLGLTGPIPDNTIGKLSKLHSLDVCNNNITSLPSDLWSLGLLKSLNLSSNRISGTLSNDIGNFGMLERLDVSNNNFSGEIPATLSSLANLVEVNFRGNVFDGSIPMGIVKCRSLVSMDFSSNQLSGGLPDGFSSAFPKLRSLNLAGNRISGRDSDLSELKSITILNISDNSFQGSVTRIFHELVEVVDMSMNQFQGHISQVQSNSSFNLSRLVYLDMSGNQLSGEISNALSRVHNLRHLNLAYNRFTSQKFPQIEMLSGLEYLNLSKTNLIGHIPSKISQLSGLHALDLSHNHLSGHIPMLGVKSLEILDVSFNNLSGEIPVPILEKLPHMEKYNFSYNNFTICDSSTSFKQKAFLGSVNDCPIAANATLFKKKGNKHKSLKLALALTLSIFFLLAGLLFLAFGCKRRQKNWAVKQMALYREEPTVSGPFSFKTDSTTWVADVKQANSVPVVIFEKPLLNITFADLLSATSNFDQGTLLAEGKFGPVYRGFLPGGIHVALKVLIHGSSLTDEEAASEFEYLGRVKHTNLVPLTGYCLAGDQRIAIYEYMENGNLQNLLHDLPLGVHRTEDWSTDTWEENDNINGAIQNVGFEKSLETWRFRHKVALGTARALAFLHHGCFPPIIHRDVKASSVYLDSDLEPRLSYFGLAKVFGTGIGEKLLHGSPGYFPPEFSESENDTPTPKSDVYCFGVVLLELITGKKPIGDDYSENKETNLVNWARSLVRMNQGWSAIDPKIRDTGPENQMEETLKIGYLCTADLPSKRPSMHQIVGLLKDIEPPVVC